MQGFFDELFNYYFLFPRYTDSVLSKLTNNKFSIVSDETIIVVQIRQVSTLSTLRFGQVLL